VRLPFLPQRERGRQVAESNCDFQYKVSRTDVGKRSMRSSSSIAVMLRASSFTSQLQELHPNESAMKGTIFFHIMHLTKCLCKGETDADSANSWHSMLDATMWLSFTSWEKSHEFQCGLA
jgi:hypothetical protein